VTRPAAWPPAAPWRRTLAARAALLLAGCSTVRPWVNEPIKPTSPAPRSLLYGVPEAEAPRRLPSIATVLALSGGGARAAAFGLGVMDELKATRFEWEGRPTTLLDSVELISGVSGGSVLAAYYAAFGDQRLTQFEHDFLLADFQGELIGDVVSPGSAHRLTSPWVGRSNLLENELDAKSSTG
jgi:NTE family protein